MEKIVNALLEKNPKKAFKALIALGVDKLIPEALKTVYNKICKFFGGGDSDNNGDSSSSGSGDNWWWWILLIILLIVAIALCYTYGGPLLEIGKAYVYKYINWEMAESALSSFCYGAGALIKAAFEWIRNLF